MESCVGSNQCKIVKFVQKRGQFPSEPKTEALRNGHTPIGSIEGLILPVPAKTAQVVANLRSGWRRRSMAGLILLVFASIFLVYSRLIYFVIKFGLWLLFGELHHFVCEGVVYFEGGIPAIFEFFFPYLLRQDPPAVLLNVPIFITIGSCSRWIYLLVMVQLFESAGREKGGSFGYAVHVRMYAARGPNSPTTRSIVCGGYGGCSDQKKKCATIYDSHL